MGKFDKMDQSFDSDSTFCSLIEDNKTRKLIEIPSELTIQYIFDKIQSHLAGKHLLGSVVIIKYMKAISKIKATALDGKKTIASLEKILHNIYKNSIIRDKLVNYEKLGTSQQDQIINSVVQDGKREENYKNCLKPFRLECMDDGKSVSFKTNISNQNFISTNSENNVGELNFSLDKALMSHTSLKSKKRLASIKNILPHDKTISAQDSTNILSKQMVFKTSTKSRICEISSDMTKDSNSKDIVGENNKSIEDLKSVTKHYSGWKDLPNTVLQTNHENKQNSFFKSVKYEECQQYYEMLGQTIEKELVSQLVSKDLDELQIKTILQQSINLCQEISRDFQEIFLINVSSHSLAEEEVADLSYLDWRII